MMMMMVMVMMMMMMMMLGMTKAVASSNASIQFDQLNSRPT
jgi:uncharacterized membrane protein YfcA